MEYAGMHNLQSFLAQLEAEHPDWIARVKERVNPNAFEVSGLLHLLERRGEHRAVVFENVLDLEGRPSPFPLAYNLFLTRPLCAVAMGMRPDQHGMELSAEFARRQEAGPRPAELVDPSVAPCREVVLRGGDADVRRLPVAMHHRRDAGAYFTMTCAMKALSGDFYDVTFTKNMVKGPRRMSFSAHPHHHLEAIVGEYEAQGRRAPVIAVLGHHPAFYLASCAMTPYGTDDYAAIGGFLQAPLRLTPSETWGDAFLVPADAEAIIDQLIAAGLKQIEADPELKRLFKRTDSAPGFAAKAALIAVAELVVLPPMTARQWVAQAGIDVREERSGTSVRRKPRISKRGNKRLREALFYPALTAAR